MDKNTFLAKLKEKQMTSFNYYDYSEIPDSFLATEKIKLKCPEHGHFLQTAAQHLDGSGCVQCYWESRRTGQDTFIQRAREIHGDRYDYSGVVYKQSRLKVDIGCKLHGVFSQTPYDHLKGSGCAGCYQMRNRDDQETFLEKAKGVHGDNYIYDKVSYSRSNIPVTITCRKHGDFEQLPGTHLRGHGCILCFESKGEKGIVDVLESLSIKYVREYSFPNSRMRYDFFLPEQNILIEFHGKQHYKPVDYWGGEEGFIKQQQRDEEKVRIAKENNIPLIVLNHHHLESKVLVTSLCKYLREIYRYWYRIGKTILVFKTAKEVCSHFKIKNTIIPSELEKLLWKFYPEVTPIFQSLGD